MACSAGLSMKTVLEPRGLDYSNSDSPKYRLKSKKNVFKAHLSDIFLCFLQEKKPAQYRTCAKVSFKRRC